MRNSNGFYLLTELIFTRRPEVCKKLKGDIFTKSSQMLNCGISQQLNKIRANRQYVSEKQQRGYKTCHMVKQLLHAASGNLGDRKSKTIVDK